MMFGEGWPVALHTKVTLSPSLTTKLLELVSCWLILGGTENSNFILTAGFHSRTNYIKVYRSVHRRVGVDLTHVPASVSVLYTIDVQVPFILSTARQKNPWITCDYMGTDC